MITPTVNTFITGMPRSGTTLLDKLISNHPDAVILSQPLPLLYVEVKRAFDRDVGRQDAISSAHPLNDMFGPTYYDPVQFLTYVRHLRLDRKFISDVLAMMENFAGQYFKPDRIPAMLLSSGPRSLYRFVTEYACEFANNSLVRVIGCKEVFCDDYIPYYLAAGARVIVVVRDPRDVLTSLSHGRAANFAGLPRPPLFHVRQWRKSIAFALKYLKHPRFLAIRYEDLVSSPARTMAQVSRHLGLAPMPRHVFENELRTRSGSIWMANSSHFTGARITTSSVGVYRQHLSNALDRFVQATCFGELRALGYEVAIGRDEIAGALAAFADDPPLQRPAFSGYNWSRARLTEEQARWSHLADGTFVPPHFVFRQAYEMIRACVLGHGRHLAEPDENSL